MKIPTPKRLLQGTLKCLLALCVILVLVVLTWGRIDGAPGGVRLRIGHPNEVLLIALVLSTMYVRLRYGISFGAQLQHVSDFADRHREKVPLVLMIAAFVYLARIKLFQHFTFHTGAYDLAMYDTAIRNTLQGDFMLADQLGRNFFSEHFSPILLVLCPPYLLADTPVTALLAEVLVVAIGTGFVYGIARHYGLPVIVAALTALIFLNYKYLAQGVMFDFHPEMMEPTFLLATLYCMLKRRWWRYFGCLVLALCCKEDVAIYTFCLGLYGLFARPTRYAALGTCALSLAWAAIAWTLIIPGAMPHDASVSHFVSSRWGHLGDGYLEVATTLLRTPLYVMGRMCSAAPIEMLALLGFVPLLGIEVLLLAVPGLVLNTTAAFDMQATLQAHYAAPIVPFVCWAFIVGLVRLRHLAQRLPTARKHPERIPAVGLALLVFLAVTTFGSDYAFYALTPHARARYRIMRQLEPGSTVSCENGFVPHLTRSSRPFLFPVEANHNIHYRDCDYILVDKDGNPWPLQEPELKSTLETILNAPQSFTIVAAEDNIYLLRVGVSH